MKKILSLLMLSLSIKTILFSQTVFSATCGGVETGFDFGCNPKHTGITGLLFAIVNFLAVGVGIAVVGGIIWGGIIYATASGDTGKTKQAVSIITNSIIGLILFVFMYAIINFLVPGGLFN